MAIGRVARGAEEAVSLEPGQCNPVEERFGELTPFFRSLIEYRLSGSDRVASTELARRPAIDAVQAMREAARQLDIPFVLVIFPDRVLVDSELRELMSLEPDDVAAPRRIHSIVSDLDPHLWIVDTSDVLDGRVGMYRRSDTHLSDLGNQVTGRYVANALAKYFADNE